MAAATATISSPPSAADELVRPQVTRWRQKRELESADELAENDSGLAPSAYKLPRLLPAPNSAETSERPAEVMTPLQSWEGVVLSVDDASFAVRLIDVAGDHPDEEVVLSIEELCDFDLRLLEPGAILYWTIGYVQRAHGARERVSRIRLRRLPAWSRRELDETRERATALARELDW